MGTNYYAVSRKPTTVHPLHIGKSSHGWKFHFRKYDAAWEVPFDWEYPLNTYERWKEFLKANELNGKMVILDEYDEPISCEEFLKLVAEKQKENNPYDFGNCENINGYRFDSREFC